MTDVAGWAVFVEAIEAVEDGIFDGINPSNGNSRSGDHKIKQDSRW